MQERDPRSTRERADAFHSDASSEYFASHSDADTSSLEFKLGVYALAIQLAAGDSDAANQLRLDAAKLQQRNASSKGSLN